MFRRYRADRCYIIAEIGGNFTSFEEARQLIDAAAQAGADAIKLQTYRAETVASRVAVFDMENTGITSQFELFEKYQIGAQLHRDAFAYAESRDVDWFSTPSHETDVDFLEECGVGAYKIGSDDATNLPFLRYVARIGKPVLLSTGMCTLQEVREAADAIVGEGNRRLIILHAITSYPAHPENINLKAIQTLVKEFAQFDIGYSDHTLTPVASLCAAAMGARVIERHFTLDKQADGPDHRLSTDPAEMRWLVEAIRSFEVMRGDGIKQPAASETATRVNNRKSIVLDRDLAAGHRLTAADLAIKRPGTGIQPKHLDQIIGLTLDRAMTSDTVLHWEDLA